MLAVLILTGIASSRGGEYGEFYMIFLISGHPRPVWPTSPFLADSVRGKFRGGGSFGAIERDLRALEVHPPFYFWLAKLWRGVVGSSLFRTRMLSVILGVGGHPVRQ